MLTHHRSVSISFMSTNLPILHNIESAATLYERENKKFHLVLSSGNMLIAPSEKDPTFNVDKNQKSLLWLEISPYRVILTQQGKECVNYRYFWEPGVYGINKYWLNDSFSQENHNFRLRNFTRNLSVKGNPVPESLRIDYELWSDRLNLGHYVFHLEMN